MRRYSIDDRIEEISNELDKVSTYDKKYLKTDFEINKQNPKKSNV